MIKKPSDRYFLTTLSLGAILTILVGILFLDQPIAVGIMRILRSNSLLHSATATIPDTLLYLACIGTTVMWLVYFILRRHNWGSDELLQFLQLAGTAVPVSFLLKAALQFAFGRTNTRFWLINNMPLRFDWFHGAGIGCFPSGHMTVFTAFGVTIWYVYPRYRRPTALLLVLLGMALIMTDYHFLSDVIAGAWVALLLVHGIRYLLKRCGANHWIEE